MFNKKKRKQTSLVKSIARIIQHSQCNPKQFYLGLVFRTLERFFEIAPILIFCVWLFAHFKHNSIQILPSDLTSLQTMVIICITLLITFIAQFTCSYFGQKMSFKGSYQISEGYRKNIIERVRNIPLGTLYQHRSGYLGEILTDDVKKIETIFTHLACDLLSAIIAPSIILIGFLIIDWKLAISLITFLPIAFLILTVCKNKFVQVSNKKQDLFRNTAGILVEFISGLKTLRLYNQAPQKLRPLIKQFDHIKKVCMDVEAWGATPVVSYRLVLELSLVLFLFICSETLVNHSTVTLDTHYFMWVLYLLVAPKLLTSFMEVAEHVTVLHYAVQSELKIERLLTEQPLLEPIKPKSLTSNNIEFKNVSFDYGQGSVLNNISFAIPQNTMTAIVGTSGAGKSSIMNLLARFYEPVKGSIYIDNINLKDLGNKNLYQNVSMVFQHVQLFDDSIMNNVRMGRWAASDIEVLNACKAAMCTPFIESLPAGYQTKVGENGVRLSGGERQRISIARAILKDAPILLLDEATASVDPESQHDIQLALNKLASGKTVLMIAHRLTTVVGADQILVLDSGTIVEKGKHEQLLNGNKLYIKLWRAQSQR